MCKLCCSTSCMSGSHWKGCRGSCRISGSSVRTNLRASWSRPQRGRFVTSGLTAGCFFLRVYQHVPVHMHAHTCLILSLSLLMCIQCEPVFLAALHVARYQWLQHASPTHRQAYCLTGGCPSAETAAHGAAGEGDWRNRCGVCCCKNVRPNAAPPEILPHPLQPSLQAEGR